MLRIPAGIPGQLTMLVFLSLSSSFPSLSSPAALITSWRGAWNTLEVVDLAEALTCGTGNASGDGTPRPWAALWRACICQEWECPGKPENALESQSPGPYSASVRLWDLRCSHLPATMHGACPGPVGLRHCLGPSPTTCWSAASPLALSRRSVGRGEAGAFPADPLCPGRVGGAGVRISDSV